MEIAAVIRKYRKEKGLTQDQLAERLGVSAPAVNKWENGNSYPDITLLAPLARALGTNIDTLLCFRENLTDKEVYGLSEEMMKTVQEKGIEAAFLQAEEWLRKYPNCELLYLYLAQMLDGCRVMFGGEKLSKEQEEKIISWYQRAAESSEKKIADSAVPFLVSDFIRKERYEEARALLDKVPEPGYDKRAMSITLLKAEKRYDEAYKEAEKYLYTVAVIETNLIFSQLADIASIQGDYDSADKYAEILEKHCETFKLWAYSHYVIRFEVAAARKDKEACLNAMEAMIEAFETPWNLKDQFLFRHMDAKENDRETFIRMREMFKKNCETSAELDFLKEEPRYKKLMEM